MLTTSSDSIASGIGTSADLPTLENGALNSGFHPIMGENICIQAIIEGALLAEVELESIPDYGVHF